MLELVNIMSEQLSRRELIGRAASAGLGAASLLRAQTGNSFPQVPSWKTEMRQLAPNIFAYVQAGGPGMLNQGVSNAGLIVDDDHVTAIDSPGAPLQSRAFLAAIQKTAPSKPIRRVLITHHHGDHIWGLPFFPAHRGNLVASLTTAMLLSGSRPSNGFSAWTWM